MDLENHTLTTLGIGLYLASAGVLRVAETAEPTPSNRSTFAMHPLLTLGEGAGASVALYGLYRMKPSYAAWGVAGYFFTQWFLFPKPKAGAPVPLSSSAEAYLPGHWTGARSRMHFAIGDIVVASANAPLFKSDSPMTPPFTTSGADGQVKIVGISSRDVAPQRRRYQIVDVDHPEGGAFWIEKRFLMPMSVFESFEGAATA